MYYKWRNKWVGPSGTAELRAGRVVGRLEWSDIGTYIVVRYGRSVNGAPHRAKRLAGALGVRLGDKEDLNMILGGALQPCSVFEVHGLIEIPAHIEASSLFSLAERPI